LIEECSYVNYKDLMGLVDKIKDQKKVISKLQKTMEKINYMGRIGIKITSKAEKLQKILSDRLIRAIEGGAFKDCPEEETQIFLEKLQGTVISLKMIIVCKMYEVKTFEEVELDINLSNLKLDVEGPNLIK